jgi:hypothetical protein
MDVERRRSARVYFSKEQAAVVHAGGREILVRVVDFSPTGALLSVLDLPAESSSNYGERVTLSMHVNESVVQVAARVVRSTPGYVAVEFSETFSGTFGESS